MPDEGRAGPVPVTAAQNAQLAEMPGKGKGEQRAPGSSWGPFWVWEILVIKEGGEEERLKWQGNSTHSSAV